MMAIRTNLDHLNSFLSPLSSLMMDSLWTYNFLFYLHTYSVFCNIFIFFCIRNIMFHLAHNYQNKLSLAPNASQTWPCETQGRFCCCDVLDCGIWAPLVTGTVRETIFFKKRFLDKESSLYLEFILSPSGWPNVKSAAAKFSKPPILLTYLRYCQTNKPGC